MIYVFLADGCEEIEALTPVDVLRRAKKDVKVVGVGKKTIVSSHNIAITCDADTSQVLPGEDIEAVVLPGGMPGTLNLEKSERVNEFIDRASKDGKLICAICAAPSVLGHKNLLSGKTATCFPGFEKDLYGAVATGAPVERDGNIITARGMGVALEFGLKIAEALCGSDVAENIKSSVQSE